VSYLIEMPLGSLRIDDTRDVALLREALAIIDGLRGFAVTPNLSVQLDGVRISTLAAAPHEPDRPATETTTGRSGTEPLPGRPTWVGNAATAPVREAGSPKEPAKAGDEPARAAAPLATVHPDAVPVASIAPTPEALVDEIQVLRKSLGFKDTVYWFLLRKHLGPEYEKAIPSGLVPAGFEKLSTLRNVMKALMKT